jgi:DNA ligase-associated metallophosphoesterase
MTQMISLKGEALELLPERAMWWPKEQALILSDLHWGKSAHFRKHGIPMPGSTQQQDALRLARIVAQTGARQLIIAGDLFHSRHNSEVDDFRRWRDAHEDLKIDFIMGNHDILDASFYKGLGFVVYEQGMECKPFYIAHDELLHPTLYTIHGHLHPGISIPGVKAHSLPVFAVGSHALILPAFGRFTGCKRIHPGNFEALYVVGEEKVLKLK